MKPASAKQKGRLFQQWIRDLLLHHNPELQPDDVRSTSMGNGGEDIQLSPAARQKFPHQIECKSRASFALYTDYKQAQAHGKHEAILFIKANNKKPLAILDAEYLVQLIRNQK
jgi:hypothetical protein